MQQVRRIDFLRDLDERVKDLERVLPLVEGRAADRRLALGTIRAHIHNIFGTGTPFGVPEATAAAGRLDRRLRNLETPDEADLRALRACISDLKAILRSSDHSLSK